MLRVATAVVAGKAVRALARRRGGGSALPGLVAETIAPDVLAHALADVPRGIVVVSGTNGKTTTTKMLVALLRAHGRDVFTNPTGSNFTRGVLSEMLPHLPRSGRLAVDTVVVELDEAHAMRFIAEVPPTHSLLLNVARDQLDRFAEIDHTADLLARLGAASTEGVVANADDPFIARAATWSGCRCAGSGWTRRSPTGCRSSPSTTRASTRPPRPTSPAPATPGSGHATSGASTSSSTTSSSVPSPCTSAGSPR